MQDDREVDAAFATYWACQVVCVWNKVKFKKRKEKDFEIDLSQSEVTTELKLWLLIGSL